MKSMCQIFAFSFVLTQALQTGALAQSDIPESGGNYYSRQTLREKVTNQGAYKNWIAQDRPVVLKQEYKVSGDRTTKAYFHQEVLNEGNSDLQPVLIIQEGTFAENGSLIGPFTESRADEEVLKSSPEQIEPIAINNLLTSFTKIDAPLSCSIPKKVRLKLPHPKRKPPPKPANPCDPIKVLPIKTRGSVKPAPTPDPCSRPKGEGITMNLRQTLRAGYLP